MIPLHTFAIIEAFFISLVLSLDTFIAAFSYGMKKIRIPFLSVLVIDGICSLSVALSLIIGLLIKNIVPVTATTALCFAILFLLGLCKMLDGMTKSLIQKYGVINSNIKFSAFNFRFVLSVYANPEWADIDQSKIISPKEAITLSIALSLDGCAAGFGTAFGSNNGICILLFSFLLQTLAITSGTWLGNRAAKRLTPGFSWVGGLVLICLAFLKLFL